MIIKTSPTEPVFFVWNYIISEWNIVSHSSVCLNQIKPHESFWGDAIHSVHLTLSKHSSWSFLFSAIQLLPTVSRKVHYSPSLSNSSSVFIKRFGSQLKAGKSASQSWWWNWLIIVISKARSLCILLVFIELTPFWKAGKLGMGLTYLFTYLISLFIILKASQLSFNHVVGQQERIKKSKNKCRWEGSSGWGTHIHPWLIHVNAWQKPLQYCKVISLQLK